MLLLGVLLALLAAGLWMYGLIDVLLTPDRTAAPCARERGLPSPGCFLSPVPRRGCASAARTRGPAAAAG